MADLYEYVSSLGDLNARSTTSLTGARVRLVIGKKPDGEDRNSNLPHQINRLSTLRIARQSGLHGLTGNGLYTDSDCRSLEQLRTDNWELTL
jgi:hypothetical protein